MTPPAPRPRARKLGLTFGSFPTGPHNAITDVPGVRVGHVTVWRDEPDGGVARTGLHGRRSRRPRRRCAADRWPPAWPCSTVPESSPARSRSASGAILESPIVLVSTNNVGRGYDALVDAALAEGVDDVVVPVVGECDDSWLDDITPPLADGRPRPRGARLHRGRPGCRRCRRRRYGNGDDGPQGRDRHGVPGGRAARHGRCAPTVQLRRLASLRIGGVPVGETLADERSVAPTLDDGGICIGVVLTDIPLDARQLPAGRPPRRPGLARVGSVAHNGSGDIFCAVSTQNRRPAAPRASSTPAPRRQPSSTRCSPPSSTPPKSR